MKKRIVVNLKRSGVSRSSRKSQRVLLPRALDLTWDVLEILRYCEEHGIKGEMVTLILDFADGFFQIPLNPGERPFAVIYYRGRYHVFNRAPQGSRGAPLLWGHVAALRCRLGVSVMLPRRSSINCYVDGPAIHVYGNEAITHRALARLVGSWLALGVRMAFRKAVLCGFRGVVTWTSIRFTVLPDAIVLQIKEQIVEDVLTQAKELLANNKIHEDELRQYLGRANCIAGLMIAWRPFLGDAVGSALQQDCARHCRAREAVD